MTASGQPATGLIEEVMRHAAAFLFPALLLASCGYNEGYVRKSFQNLSDEDLITASHVATSPGMAVTNPMQRRVAVEEMKRRGLLGPGREGNPR